MRAICFVALNFGALFFASRVGGLADEFRAIFVPLHELFQEQLRYRPADMFCPEPVHPNSVGHLLIAHAWLTAMGW